MLQLLDGPPVPVEIGVPPPRARARGVEDNQRAVAGGAPLDKPCFVPAETRTASRAISASTRATGTGVSHASAPDSAASRGVIGGRAA